jgi:hypothetical protein
MVGIIHALKTARMIPLFLITRNGRFAHTKNLIHSSTQTLIRNQYWSAHCPADTPIRHSSPESRARWYSESARLVLTSEAGADLQRDMASKSSPAIRNLHEHAVPLEQVVLDKL